MMMETKKTELISRKNYRKLVRFMVDDIKGFMASQGFSMETISINGNTNPPPPKKPSYNPIELE